MANRKATMTDIRVIIREFVRGTSLREMERKLHISRTSLRAYRDRAEASGKAMVDLLNLEDAELNAIMVKSDGHRSRDADRYAFMMANVEEYAQQMKRKHMTYDVLYTDYQKATDSPYGYTQFKAAVSAIVLVCVLPYSMLSYVTALPNAKMEYLFQALSKAVEYFGGVAEISKTDNMRQWIKKANRYEPTLNEAASQWCLHYGTDLDECRSRKPRDKGPAESLVNQAYRYYYSRICRETFFSIEELNRKLDELNDLYNNRDRKNKTYSRREQFEKEELPYLLPLPSSRFLFKYEKEIVINTTYHFQVDKIRFYSVPYQYVGKKAKVVYDAETVEVWVDFVRIAAHKRLYTEGYSTIAEHMPPNHLAYLKSKDINAAYLLSKASQIGPNTRASIDCILKSALFVQQAYRACQGVLRLAVQYGADRLEAACQRIEPKTASTYKRIEAILKSNLDELPLMPSNMTPYIPANDNVRGASEYQ